MHRRGFGFVKPFEAPGIPEIFIPKGETAGAITGDTVEVRYRRSPKGFDGQVVDITKRSRSELAGVVTDAWPNEVLVHVPLLGQDTIISAQRGNQKAQEGTRVILRVNDWSDSPEAIQAEVIDVLGSVENGSTDVPYALREQQIRNRFPTSVTRLVSEFANEVTDQDRKGRLDLRKLETITIDPASAKDFDDALHLTRDQKGRYQLAVHIADVSHYVTRGSPLDDEAQLRCNSTYFPEKCVPMLPPALADNLCSLKPDVERLAVTVQMQFDSKGKLLGYQIDRSVIRSRKRLSYEEAKQILDGKAESPFAPMLNLMVDLCAALKHQRRLRGGIEFVLPEIVVEVDRKGEPKTTRLVEYDITHQLVEEFMLKANEVVATHLMNSGRAIPYRVHEQPSQENLLAFCQLAKAFGFHLPSSPTPQDLQALFDRAQKTPSGEFLAVAYIRSMKQAAYSPDNIGHYGLSLERYCHFTSPIRRYADLIVHRTLFGDGYSDEELQAISSRTSEQERISARAEETVLRYKKLRLLNQWHEVDVDRQYEAIVTRATGAGIAFELPSLMLGGFLPISQLDSDYYVFHEERQELRGRDSGRTFACGTKIDVGVMLVDLIFGDASWHLVSDSPSIQSCRRKRSYRR